MYLFKTSGKTFDSVITNQKHAFLTRPKDWVVGELVLVSKNKADCRRGEKQIQYTMKLDEVRPLAPGESEKYWPGTEGRWKYLVGCSSTSAIRPFNLEDLLSDEAKAYAPIMTFAKLAPEHEKLVDEYLAHTASRE